MGIVIAGSQPNTQECAERPRQREQIRDPLNYGIWIRREVACLEGITWIVFIGLVGLGIDGLSAFPWANLETQNREAGKDEGKDEGKNYANGRKERTFRIEIGKTFGVG
ncbi:hypothetical protein F5Y05DRAFT_407769 [Hypoxylon sp. FL0543]|nr:hypothetical protein F5Y05DRAFT_407769 [Hypoxylon sp. FL0543]